MADISQIQISNTVYDIKDNSARTEINEMPHATSGTIGGWTIYDTYLESGLKDALEKMELHSSCLASPSRPAIMGWTWNNTSEDYDDQTLFITSSSIYVESFSSEEGYFEGLEIGGDLSVNGEASFYSSVLMENGLTVDSGAASFLNEVQIDGTLSANDNIYLTNDKYLYGTDVSSNNLILAGISDSNQVIYGDTSYDTLLNGSSIYLSGTTSISGALAVTGRTTLSSTLTVTNATTLSNTLSVSGNITGSGVIYLANNKALYVKDTNGTNQYIAGLNSSNQNLFGNTTYPTYIRGSTNYLQGATSLNSTLAVSGAATLSSSLTVSGTIYKGSLATKQIVSIQTVTVSASSAIATGSSTSLTGTFTAVSGASYIIWSRGGLNYGYFMGSPSYSGTTITISGYNNSGETHTLSGSVVVLAYV